jgi:mannose-6-phosphate isomerase class I
MSVDIFLLPEQKENINKNKTTFIKNFSKIKKEYDFNLLTSFIEKNEVRTYIKNNPNENEFFTKVIQLTKLENLFPDFKLLQDFLRKVFKYSLNEKDGCDVFFSLKSSIGANHVDKEDVFIIGLNGVTIYKTFGEDIQYYQIHKGDLIYIPRGLPHKVIGLSPRVILSVGFFGNQQTTDKQL